ncbi:RNA polymerase II transcription factor SIII subunit A-domain-containing protein [Cryomyces antarcticus]
MPCSSLLDLSRRACIRNIDGITDVGDLPYHLLRPILLKIENPEQLREIETASPQICGHDAELWRAFMKRDIPNWEKKPHEPRNPNSWGKVYRKLLREDEEEQRQSEEVLRAALNIRKEEKEKNQATIIHKVIDPEKRKARPAAKSSSTALLSFGGGSRTKTNTAQGVLDRARRETQEARNARNSALAMPTHLLNVKASQVRQAPRGMVVGYNRPAPPKIIGSSVSRPAPIFISRPVVTDRDRALNAAIKSEREERERRLKALTGLSNTAAQKTLTPPRVPGASGVTSLPGIAAAGSPMSRTASPAPAPAPQQRKRPGYDPFMAVKRRKV